MNPEEESNLQEQRDEILALQSIFNTDDEENIKVISEYNDDGTSLFSLLVTVRVKPTTERTHIDIIMPQKNEEPQGATAMLEETSHLPTFPKNVQLNRSISEAHWIGSFEVKYLTPLLLYVTFPTSYPSSTSPSFHVDCSWLKDIQIQSLVTMLKQLWEDGLSMPILFTCINWLENCAFDHLGISDHLTLQACDPDNSASGMNEAATQENSNWQEGIGEIIAYMTQYNRNQMDIEFCQNAHECEVCFEERPGTQFFRVFDCNHKYCHDCMMAYCELHVGEGTVEELRCPDTKCDNLLPPYILESVLDPEAYMKWEKLLLQKTLDSMSDTVYCPRCQSLVIAEEGDLNLAHCTVCFFSFCTECNRVWHQGTNCQTDDDLIEVLEQKSKTTNKAERKELDAMLRKMRAEAETKKAMERGNIRTCPKCRIKVEKIGGCNKMTCKCSQMFCWLCGKSITGYGHFHTGKCDLMTNTIILRPAEDVPEAVLKIRARIAINPGLERKQSRCPSCKQLNLKDSSNNHLKCWNCKSNYCFLCQQRIYKNVTLHFQGPCYQHS